MKKSKSQLKIQNFSKTKKVLPCKKNGFTLIEMLVAVSLFVFVMLIGVGVLLSIIDANRKARALSSVMNNLNFALESMSRNIRVEQNIIVKKMPALFRLILIRQKTAIPANYSLLRCRAETSLIRMTK